MSVHVCIMCGILYTQLAVTETLRPASLRYPRQALYRERLFMLQCVQSAPHCQSRLGKPSDLSYLDRVSSQPGA